MSKEIQLNGYTYDIECVHSGQYHPYGDTFRVYNIKTNDENKESILDVVKIALGYDVPQKKDWNCGDIDDYFNGYCEVEEIDGGFKYTKCEPYTD